MQSRSKSRFFQFLSTCALLTATTSCSFIIEFTEKSSSATSRSLTAPAVVVTDSSDGSSTATDQANVNVTLNSDPAAIGWWMVDQASGDLPPASPLLDDSQWISTAPTQMTLSGVGSRTVYVFTKTNSAISPYGLATINYSPLLSAPTVALSDATDGSSSLTDAAIVNVSLTSDPAAIGWWVVEQSAVSAVPSAPALNDVGWLSAAPTQVTLTSAGLRIVYVFIKSSSVVSSYGSASINYSTISDYLITGMTSPSESTLDALVLGTDPILNFQNPSNESGFELTIKNAAGTTLCSTTAPANSTSATFAGCAVNLTHNEYYNAEVAATAPGESRAATNSPYIFRYRNAQSLGGANALKLHYSFDSTSVVGANVSDLSGNSNTGVITGAASVPGRYGQGLSFSAGTHMVSTPHSASLAITTGLTMAAWIYTAVGGGEQTVMLKQSGGDAAYVLYAGAGGPPIFYINQGSYVSSQATTNNTLGTWMHLASTYNGSEIKMYVNGVLENTVSATGPVLSGTEPLQMGRNAIWGESFSGTLDEAYLYNTPLTQTQIQTLMNLHVSSPESFLILGANGGTDTVSDNFLLDSLSSPRFTWATSKGAKSYQVEIRNFANTTVCGPQTVAGAQNVTMSSCPLSANTTYKIHVTAIASDGVTKAATNDGMQFRTGNDLVLAKFPHSGSNWNDYVQFVSGDRFLQDDQTCSITNTAHYHQCLHGGERRYLPTTQASCSGLTAEDTQGFFNWVCREISGNAVLISTGLRDGVMLSDLINLGASTWKTNSLMVRLMGSTILTTQSSAWWTNTISPLPDNSQSTDAPVILTGTGTIYTLASSRATSGYSINTSRVGIAMPKTARLEYSMNVANNCNGNAGTLAGASYKNLLCLGSADHLWIEGTYDHHGAQPAGNADLILASHIRESVFRNIRIGRGIAPLGSGGIGLQFRFNNTGNLIRSVDIFDPDTGETSGFVVWLGSNYNIFSNLKMNGNIHIGNGGDTIGNIFSDMLLQPRGTSSFNVWENSRQNTLSHVTLFNYYDSHIGGTGNTGNVFNQMAFVSGGTALTLDRGGGNTFSQMALTSSTNRALVFVDVGSSNAFVNNLLVGSSTGNCHYASGSTNGGIADATCANQAGSSAVLRTGLPTALSSFFKGYVSTTDASNGSNANGVSAFAAITDFFNFSSRMRTWYEQATFDWCIAGRTCQIFDFSLSANDTFLLGRSGNGIDSTENQPFIAGSACPTAASGARTLTDQLGNTFQINSLERFNDGLGDDDGLCESNEACVYSPNFGAYQGHGDYVSLGTCTFQNGGVTGVQMYAYPNNGVP